MYYRNQKPGVIFVHHELSLASLSNCHIVKFSHFLFFHLKAIFVIH